jgi:hypothetical protein
MLCNTQGHSREDRARHDICIVELKTCQDTPTELTAARLQHEELVERLVQRGYQRDKIKIYPILLGVSGTIYAAHTIDTLEQLGCSGMLPLSCAREIHPHGAATPLWSPPGGTWSWSRPETTPTH